MIYAVSQNWRFYGLGMEITFKCAGRHGTVLHMYFCLQVFTVLLEDLIGVQVMPKPPANNPNACEFDINYYPKVIRRGGEKMDRKLITATVQFDCEPIFKDNLFQAIDWKKAVNLQTQRALRKIFHNADTNSLQCMLLSLHVHVHVHNVHIATTSICAMYAV